MKYDNLRVNPCVPTPEARRIHEGKQRQLIALPQIFLGRCDEWHVEINKSRRENEMGEKGLTCLDGVEQKPIFGKEAYGCNFLTKDVYGSKSDFSDANICRMTLCRSAIF